MPRPPRPWFRFWAEAVDSLKLHAMPDRLMKPWLFMLCMACEQEPRGQLPSIAKIAFRLRLKEERVKIIIADLIELRLIDSDGVHYFMHNWDEWQKDSDARRGGSAAKPPQNARDTAAIPQPFRNDSAVQIREEKIEIKEREREREREREETPADEVVVPVVRAFERCFGRLLSPMEIEQIHALADEHPRDRIDYALRETAELGKKNVRYVQRICESQEANGDERTRPDNGTNGGGRYGKAESALPSPDRAYLERVGYGATLYVEPSRTRLGEEGVGEEVTAVGVEATG